MKYSKSFQVRFTESDREARATPVALFNLLQETAIAHSDSVGMGGAELFERGFLWMMNRAHLQFLHYPKTGDELTVTTWANTLTGLFAVREWVVEDSERNVCVVSTGRWLIIDAEKKRIVKVPSFMAEMYGEVPERALEDDFKRDRPIETGEIEREFHVRVSDLDTNQHANSACYVDWCLEGVHDNVLATCRPTSFEITYKKECTLGEGLRVISAEEDSDANTFRHVIRSTNDGTPLATAISRWQAGYA